MDNESILANIENGELQQTDDGKVIVNIAPGIISFPVNNDYKTIAITIAELLDCAKGKLIPNETLDGLIENPDYQESED